MFSGEADRLPLIPQQDGLDPETSMIGKATAGVEEELLVSLCIICNLIKSNSKLIILLEVKNTCPHKNKKSSFKRCVSRSLKSFVILVSWITGCKQKKKNSTKLTSCIRISRSMYGTCQYARQQSFSYIHCTVILAYFYKCHYERTQKREHRGVMDSISCQWAIIFLFLFRITKRTQTVCQEQKRQEF